MFYFSIFIILNKTNFSFIVFRLIYFHPDFRVRAGKVGAVEALVHALDRFARRKRLKDAGELALRHLTTWLPLNEARLAAAGGAHYLQ